MNLYRIDTQGLRSFFVVAKDPTEAEIILREMLDKADYGSVNARKVTSFHLISSEAKCLDGNPKPNFTDDNRLILPKF